MPSTLMQYGVLMYACILLETLYTYLCTDHFYMVGKLYKGVEERHQYRFEVSIATYINTFCKKLPYICSFEFILIFIYIYSEYL